MARAYLDHAATSPMPETVLAAYTAALRTVGNPASQHGHGQQARDVLESARETIANMLKVTSSEVIFTSGGTESINLALKGFFWARNNPTGTRPVVLIAEGEHHATIDTAAWLERTQNAQIHLMPLDKFGVLHPNELQNAIDQYGAEQIAVASVIWANNEIGTVQPVERLAEIADTAGIPLHIDAVSALGQVDLSTLGTRPAALSLSAHKIGGPVASGALILRRDWTPEALIHGGSQQRVRSGTQDTAGAVGFAAAMQEAQPNSKRLQRMRELRDRLITGIREIDPSAILRGPDPKTAGEDARLAANAHFTFPGCQGDSLLFMLDIAGVSVSTGSACTAGVTEVSHVMLAIGLPEDEAAGALRFTLSSHTRDDEVDALLTALPSAIERARQAGLNSHTA
ncbi:MAG: cysteine desulfurase family protein [Canibacter sp.]